MRTVMSPNVQLASVRKRIVVSAVVTLIVPTAESVAKVGRV